MRQSFFLFTTALRALSAHKGRSLLTVSSLVIGIAAVIATLAIGRGAEEKIRRRIEQFGTNCVFIYAGNNLQTGATNQKKNKKALLLTHSDIHAITHACDDLAAITPMYYANSKIARSNGTSVVLNYLTGTNEHFLHIQNLSLAYGRSLNSGDIIRQAPVAVIGSKVAAMLFKNRNPIGKAVTIVGRTFIVIGVLEERTSLNRMRDDNLNIYIPHSLSKQLLPHLPPGMVHAISLSAYTRESVSRLERQVRRLLRARHNLQPSEPDDFTLWNQDGMAQAAASSSAVFNIFLLIVASISLLVGGIGVMNIMLVSVTERTQEIGIRMALGATPANILYQFLIESIMLCTVGGFLGTLLGVTVPVLITYYSDWLAIVSTGSIMLACCITLLIGIIFGLYPAYRASRMNIITALLNR